MRSLRRRLSDLSIPRKLSLIIGLFSIVIIGLLGLSYFGMEILSGSRAYVGGEGLWSKAQKAAVFHLTRYALFQDEAEYQNYLSHIAIPLGDREARIELEKPQFDFDVVAQGFLKGRNDPADFPIMILMVRRFYNVPHMRRAIIAWREADAQLADLQGVADTLHHEIQSGQARTPRIKALLEEIRNIDAQLTPLEDEFSYALGEGARWLKAALLLVMLLATSLFLTLVLIIAYWISRQLCSEIDHLREGAKRIAAGDYQVSLRTDSKDEIGDLARTFQEMAVQREGAERLKDEFFANASHELRTPLTLILSPLESLLFEEYGPLDPKARAAAETMHNNAMRLLQLVNGILDFSKLEAGKIQVHREPLKIADLSEMIYHDFKPLFRDRRLEARLDIEPVDAVVMMDRYLYERILFNLLSNAVKFTAPGGRVTARVRWAESLLTISVTDSGIGIPSDQLQNIFQRFRQVEGSSTRRFEGTGLGLALVKEFAELLEGTAGVESRVGQGSTFRVTCSAPAGERPPVRLDSPRTAQSMRAQQYAPSLTVLPLTPSRESLPKVLIAEDNLDMATYIAALLQPFCQTKIVRDGNEALKAVNEWPPDLVLTDVMMPERNGIDVCRELKANPTTASIPVVMLTALTHREALIEGWKAGANEYLFKPFHPRELVTRIQTLLKARQDLEAATRELEAFSYSVSHDLRTPLRAIDGFSRELLQNNRDALDERGRGDLERILAATQRMAELIDDLLELSQISRRELKTETVDLGELTRQIIQDLRKAHPARAVELVVTSNLRAPGDSHLMRIALENLLNNAWKFTQRQPRAKIEVGVCEQKGRNVFFVKDNGVGFSMAYSGKLFKPFQRLHDAQEFPGTGIGLALVQRIVHRHGGEIWTEAEEQRGATFYCALPGLTGDVPKGVEA